MTWRDMGKANFIDVQDRNGRIQVYVRMNDIGEEEYKEFKKWDIGDIVIRICFCSFSESTTSATAIGAAFALFPINSIFFKASSSVSAVPEQATAPV